MKELPLHKLHKKHNAIFKDYNGITLPSRYGPIENEYAAVSGSVGVIDFSHRGKLRLSGKEHLKFLQGMLSNDVIKLEPGNGIHTALLTVKGKMVADMYLYKDTEFVLIDLEHQLHSVIYELLLKYRLSYKVYIDDITDNYILLSFIGGRSGSFLAEFFSRERLNPEKLSMERFKYNDYEIIAVNSKRAKYDSYDIYIPIEGGYIADEILSSQAGGRNPEFIGNETYDILRVEAGIPKYGVDMDENTIPIEAGLWDALSFEKGCYVGQEVIARIRWRGHVNRHLSGIEIQGGIIPIGKDRIYSGDKEIGYVTSSAFSFESDSIIALGYIRRGYNTPGSVVTVSSGTHVLSGTVFEFPS